MTNPGDIRSTGPRSVRSTSIEETMAIITPKKLDRRTPARTSSSDSADSAPNAT